MREAKPPPRLEAFRRCLALTMLLYHMLQPILALPACGPGFPRIIGGSSKDTVPMMLDLHPGTPPKVAVSGRTCDTVMSN